MGKTHPSHPHELEFKSYKNPYRCDGCKVLGFGARYRCEQCDFNLHEDCMLASPTAHHDFFKSCTFKILHQPPEKCSHNCQRCQRYCDACARPVLGFYYHCEKQGWDLHPCCLKFPNKLSIEKVEFRLHDKVSSRCSWCKKKKTASGIRGWWYESECKEYLLHVHCLEQMMLDAWRRSGASNTDGDNSLASLENLELPVQRHLWGNRGNGSKFIKMLKLAFKAIVGILLGDPTVLLTGLLVELFAK